MTDYTQQRRQTREDYQQQQKQTRQEYTERLKKLREEEKKAKEEWQILEESKQKEYKTERQAKLGEQERKIQAKWERINKEKQELESARKRTRLDDYNKRQTRRMQVIQRRSKGKNRQIIAQNKKINNKLKRLTKEINTEMTKLLKSEEYKRWQDEQWQLEVQPDLTELQKKEDIIKDKYSEELNKLYQTSKYSRTKQQISKTEFERKKELAELEYDYKVKLEDLKQTYFPTKYTVTIKDKSGNIKYTKDYGYIPSPWLVKQDSKTYYKGVKEGIFDPTKTTFDLGKNKYSYQPPKLEQITLKSGKDYIKGSYDTRTKTFTDLKNRKFSAEMKDIYKLEGKEKPKPMIDIKAITETKPKLQYTKRKDEDFYNIEQLKGLLKVKGTEIPNVIENIDFAKIEREARKSAKLDKDSEAFKLTRILPDTQGTKSLQGLFNTIRYGGAYASDYISNLGKELGKQAGITNDLALLTTLETKLNKDRITKGDIVQIKSYIKRDKPSLFSGMLGYTEPTYLQDKDIDEIVKSHNNKELTKAEILKKWGKVPVKLIKSKTARKVSEGSTFADLSPYIINPTTGFVKAIVDAQKAKSPEEYATKMATGIAFGALMRGGERVFDKGRNVLFSKGLELSTSPSLIKQGVGLLARTSGRITGVGSTIAQKSLPSYFIGSTAIAGGQIAQLAKDNPKLAEQMRRDMRTQFSATTIGAPIGRGLIDRAEALIGRARMDVIEASIVPEKSHGEIWRNLKNNTRVDATTVTHKQYGQDKLSLQSGKVPSLYANIKTKGDSFYRFSKALGTGRYKRSESGLKGIWESLKNPTSPLLRIWKGLRTVRLSTKDYAKIERQMNNNNGRISKKNANYIANKAQQQANKTGEPVGYYGTEKHQGQTSVIENEMLVAMPKAWQTTVGSGKDSMILANIPKKGILTGHTYKTNIPIKEINLGKGTTPKTDISNYLKNIVRTLNYYGARRAQSVHDSYIKEMELFGRLSKKYTAYYPKSGKEHANALYKNLLNIKKTGYAYKDWSNKDLLRLARGHDLGAPGHLESQPIKHAKSAKIFFEKGLPGIKGLTKESQYKIANLIGGHTEPIPIKGLIPHIKTTQIKLPKIFNRTNIKRIAIDLDNTLVGKGGKLRTNTNQFLKELKDRGYKLDIWTHSTKGRANKILKETGIKKYFDKVITREDYAMGKSQYTLKDIRKTGHDILIDNASKQLTKFKKLGMADKFVKISSFYKTGSTGKGYDKVLKELSQGSFNRRTINLPSGLQYNMKEGKLVGAVKGLIAPKDLKALITADRMEIARFGIKPDSRLMWKIKGIKPSIVKKVIKDTKVPEYVDYKYTDAIPYYTPPIEGEEYVPYEEREYLKPTEEYITPKEDDEAKYSKEEYYPFEYKPEEEQPYEPYEDRYSYDPKYDYEPEYDPYYTPITYTPQTVPEQQIPIVRETTKQLQGYKPSITMPDGKRIIVKELYPTRLLAEARIRELLKDNPSLKEGMVVKGRGDDYSASPIKQYKGGFVKLGSKIKRIIKKRKVNKQEKDMDILGILRMRAG